MGAVVFLASRASRLRQRPHPRGGRRLPRPLGEVADANTDGRPVPDRHRLRHAEREGRRLRRRRPPPSRAASSALRPMSRPRHGVAVHPDDDLWTSIAAASRQAMAELFARRPREIAGVGLCTIRCCKAFLRADGSLAEPVISWMDDRAYQPYCPDDPSVAYATTSLGIPRAPPHRRLRGHAPPTTSRCSGRSTPTPGSGATSPPRYEQFARPPRACCSSCSCPAM